MKTASVSRMPLALLVALATLLAVPLRPGSGPLWSQQVAYASSACNSANQGHQEDYAGWSSLYQDNGWGATATITTRIPAFCTGSGDASIDSIVAFSMIEASTGTHYAQAGYRLPLDSSTAYIWDEFTYSGCTPQFGGTYGYCDDIGPATTTNGQTHKYWTDYYNYGGFKDEDMGYDNTLLDYTPYDPASSSSGSDYWGSHWGPWTAGENHNDGDEIPGRSTSHAVFSLVGYEPAQNTYGIEPPSYNVIVGHTQARTKTWMCDAQDYAYQFEIWTDDNCPTFY